MKKTLALLIMCFASAILMGASGTKRCAMCAMMLNERTQGWLKLADGSSQHTCCPQCLFTLQAILEKQGKKVTEVWVRDFDSREEFPADKAFFVFKSKLVPCCVPSVITFKQKASADIFQQDNGGEILTLNQLKSRLLSKP
jgi:nitrous oxide reductase accessory protein NosL